MGIFKRKTEAKIRKRKEELIDLINDSCRRITIEDPEDLKKIKLRNIESKRKSEKVEIDLEKSYAFNAVFDIIDNHYYKAVHFEAGVLFLDLSDYGFVLAHSKIKKDI